MLAAVGAFLSAENEGNFLQNDLALGIQYLSSELCIRVFVGEIVEKGHLHTKLYTSSLRMAVPPTLVPPVLRYI